MLENRQYNNRQMPNYYPNKDKTDNDLSNLWNDSEEIQGFVNFKKIGVKLPVHSPKNKDNSTR